MDKSKLADLLNSVQDGKTSVDEALKRLESLPYENLGFARLDLHRDLRQGLPEVVYCQNKTPEQVLEIMRRLWEHHDRVLGTRVSPEIANYVLERLPEAIFDPVSNI